MYNSRDLPHLPFVTARQHQKWYQNPKRFAESMQLRALLGVNCFWCGSRGGVGGMMSRSAGRKVEFDTGRWQVHAEGEAEHAAIGHNAVVAFVPATQADVLRRAMLDHDRDFSAFYDHLATMLE
jgi:hypothetical protein